MLKILSVSLVAWASLNINCYSFIDDSGTDYTSNTNLICLNVTCEVKAKTESTSKFST